MLLPANTINLYDGDGKLVARLLYKDNEVAHQPCDPLSQEDNEVAHQPCDPLSQEDNEVAHQPCDPLSQEDNEVAHQPCDPPSQEDNEVAHQPCDPLSQEFTNQCQDGNLPSSFPVVPYSTVDDISSGSDEIHPNSTKRSPTAINPHSESTSSSLNAHPPARNDYSAHKDSYVMTSTHALPSTPSVVIDRNAYPPTHLLLTTLDEPEPGLLSNLKTTLAASISRLVKDDQNLLQEFDGLRSKLKEAKKNKGRQINLKEKVERYNLLSAKISLQVLAKRTQLDEAVKKFEQEYFLKHGQLPQRDLSYIQLIKERNNAKAVLRTLNVSL